MLDQNISFVWIEIGEHYNENYIGTGSGVRGRLEELQIYMIIIDFILQ